MLATFASYQRQNALQYFVHIYLLALRAAQGAEQAVRQGGQAIGFADNDARELAEFGCWQFPFEQLRRTTQATERIANLMGQLQDHATTRVPLGDERVLTVDLPPLRGVGQFDDHATARSPDRRNLEGDLDRCVTLVGRRDLHQLAEVLTIGRRAADEVLNVAKTRQQRLQRSAEADTGTYPQQGFGATVEIDECAIGIDDQDSRREAA